MSQIEDLAEKLLETTKEIETLTAYLYEQEPEVCEALDIAMDQAASLRKQVASLLKDEEHSLTASDGTEFVVKQKSRRSLDLDALVNTAEDLGHIETLFSAGVLTFKGSAGNIGNLPTELRVIYEKFVKQNSYRTVSMPKEVSTQWTK